MAKSAKNRNITRTRKGGVYGYGYRPQPGYGYQGYQGVPPPGYGSYGGPPPETPEQKAAREKKAKCQEIMCYNAAKNEKTGKSITTSKKFRLWSLNNHPDILHARRSAAGVKWNRQFIEDYNPVLKKTEKKLITPAEQALFKEVTSCVADEHWCGQSDAQNANRIYQYRNSREGRAAAADLGHNIEEQRKVAKRIADAEKAENKKIADDKKAADKLSAEKLRARLDPLRQFREDTEARAKAEERSKAEAEEPIPSTSRGHRQDAEIAKEKAAAEAIILVAAATEARKRAAAEAAQEAANAAATRVAKDAEAALRKAAKEAKDKVAAENAAAAAKESQERAARAAEAEAKAAEEAAATAAQAESDRRRRKRSVSKSPSSDSMGRKVSEEMQAQRDEAVERSRREAEATRKIRKKAKKSPKPRVAADELGLLHVLSEAHLDAQRAEEVEKSRIEAATMRATAREIRERKEIAAEEAAEEFLASLPVIHRDNARDFLRTGKANLPQLKQEWEKQYGKLNAWKKLILYHSVSGQVDARALFELGRSIGEVENILIFIGQIPANERENARKMFAEGKTLDYVKGQWEQHQIDQQQAIQAAREEAEKRMRETQQRVAQEVGEQAYTNVMNRPLSDFLGAGKEQRKSRKKHSKKLKLKTKKTKKSLRVRKHKRKTKLHKKRLQKKKRTLRKR